MEGKVQINSYSHFNVFMLIQVHRERTANPQEEEGLKLNPAPEKSLIMKGNWLKAWAYIAALYEAHTLSEFSEIPTFSILDIPGSTQ